MVERILLEEEGAVVEIVERLFNSSISFKDRLEKEEEEWIGNKENNSSVIESVKRRFNVFKLWSEKIFCKSGVITLLH